MAASHSHILGEMIGNFFEDVMKSPIKELCKKYNVYLDTFGPRPARSTLKVTWDDINGSQHDLDYVIERNGTDDNIGKPIAFIELAWRRYTKHSKNKVQEITGAVIPITQKYHESAPFMGAILSGVFTEPSLAQLTNQGFHVLYIPFDKVVESFKKFDLNIYFDEDTEEERLAEIVSDWEKSKRIDDIKADFINSNKDEINKFLLSLEASIKKQIDYLFVLPLHGKEIRFAEISQAISFLNEYSELPVDATIDRYIVGIAFNDGSHIDCMFKDKKMAVDFLVRNAVY